MMTSFPMLGTFHINRAIQTCRRFLSHNQPHILSLSWLHAWNFTTNLYRILEHAIKDCHRRQPETKQFSFPSALFHRDTLYPHEILEQITNMYKALPPEFKEGKHLLVGGKYDLEYNFSFQAANFISTIQFVRMILLIVDDSRVEKKCTFAQNLLGNFAKVPVFFLRAISSLFCTICQESEPF
jgi:hypothetical protein